MFGAGDLSTFHHISHMDSCLRAQATKFIYPHFITFHRLIHDCAGDEAHDGAHSHREQRQAADAIVAADTADAAFATAAAVVTAATATFFYATAAAAAAAALGYESTVRHYISRC